MPTELNIAGREPAKWNKQGLPIKEKQEPALLK